MGNESKGGENERAKGRNNKGYLFRSKVGVHATSKWKRPQHKCYVAALRASWQLFRIGSWKVLSLLIAIPPSKYLFFSLIFSFLHLFLNF